jgi:hypothetical protein
VSTVDEKFKYPGALIENIPPAANVAPVAKLPLDNGGVVNERVPRFPVLITVPVPTAITSEVGSERTVLLSTAEMVPPVLVISSDVAVGCVFGAGVIRLQGADGFPLHNVPDVVTYESVTMPASGVISCVKRLKPSY